MFDGQLFAKHYRQWKECVHDDLSTMTAYAIARAGGTPQTHMVIAFADYNSHYLSAAGAGTSTNANITPITLLAENFCVLSYDELPKYYFDSIDKEKPLNGAQIAEMIAWRKRGQSLPKGMVDYYLLIYFVPICQSQLCHLLWA